MKRVDFPVGYVGQCDRLSGSTKQKKEIITMIPSSVNIKSKPDEEYIKLQQQKKASVENQPLIKNPETAFHLWSYHQRNKRFVDYQHMKIKEVRKHLGDEWRQLTLEEKQPFVEEANRLKEQHERDYPNHKYRSRHRPKSVGKSLGKANVQYPMPLAFPQVSTAEEFISNTSVSAHDTESGSNSLTGSSTNSPSISNDSNVQCAVSRSSVAAHNAQTREGSYYLYKFHLLGRKDGRQKLNLSNSVHSITYNPSLVQHSFFDAEYSNEESPLDLSVRKDR